jgi:hypothetical protein
MAGLRSSLWALVLWIMGALSAGMAHPLDPALLDIRESTAGVLEILWRLPSSQNVDFPLRAVLPESCKPVAAPVLDRAGPQTTLRWRAVCDGKGLVGQPVAVTGLRERQTDALLRIQLADGRLIQQVLRGDAPTLLVPERASPFGVFRDYLRLGFEHILSGPDHLLFVLGLVLLILGWRRLLWTITAFTAGHSVTLSLAVLGVVHVPSQPVEVLIALTIVVVALELARRAPGPETLARRFPWAMAFAFGLLHGLGFAGALAQVGLPAVEIPLALFAFNLGIEAGQILWVAAVLAGRAGLSALPLRWPRPAQLVPAYAIGSLGVYWMAERAASLL